MKTWWWLFIQAHLVYSNPDNLQDTYGNTLTLNNNEENLTEKEVSANQINIPEVIFTRRKRNLQDEEQNKRQPKFHSWGGKRHRDEEYKEGTENQVEDVNYYEFISKIPSPYKPLHFYFNESNLKSKDLDTIMVTYTKRLKQSPAFSSWGGKRDPEILNELMKRAYSHKSIVQEGYMSPSTAEQNIKRYPAFNSWAGKRSASFNNWEGKRATAFNSWGGKRTAPFNSWGGKRTNAFNSWGGKRAVSFNSWGGKRPAAFNIWDRKRAVSFNGWGGKRSIAFNSWGGKRTAPFSTLRGKRAVAFSNRESKLAASFNSWRRKRVGTAFNSWGGKRTATLNILRGKDESREDNISHINFNETNISILTNNNQNTSSTEANFYTSNCMSNIDNNGDEVDEVPLRTGTSWRGKQWPRLECLCKNEFGTFYYCKYKKPSNNWSDKGKNIFTSYWKEEREAGLNSRKQKRTTTSNNWSGKRVPVFSSWAGKRDNTNVSAANYNEDVDIETQFLLNPMIHKMSNTEQSLQLNDIFRATDRKMGEERSNYLSKYLLENKSDNLYNTGKLKNEYSNNNLDLYEFIKKNMEEKNNFNTQQNSQVFSLAEKKYSQREKKENKMKKPAFSSWAGKRNPLFSSWYLNKVPTVQLSNGKRRPAFSSWGGKRSEEIETLQNNLSGFSAPIPIKEDKIIPHIIGVYSDEAINIFKSQSDNKVTRKKRESNDSSIKKKRAHSSSSNKQKRSVNNMKKNSITRMLLQGGLIGRVVMKSIPKNMDFYAWGGKRAL